MITFYETKIFFKNFVFTKEEIDNDPKPASSPVWIGSFISKGKANNCKVYMSTRTGKYFYLTKSKFKVYVEESQIKFRNINE
jgi:hypothetical protein